MPGAMPGAVRPQLGDYRTPDFNPAPERDFAALFQMPELQGADQPGRISLGTGPQPTPPLNPNQAITVDTTGAGGPGALPTRPRLVAGQFQRPDQVRQLLDLRLLHVLAQALNDPTAALLVSGERSLAAEFPSDAQARTVLTAIGSGERTFTNIGRAAGDIPQGSLNRSLKTLAAKRVVAVDEPLSTKPGSKDKRYSVADPYLRFWLAFLGPHLGEIERGRGDRVLARIRTSWTSWRGRTIEPVIREALERLAPPVLTGENGVPGAVGSYWTRTNNPEIDLVVGDRTPVAKRVLALGSIKWLENAPFDRHDLGELHAHRTQLPGAAADTPLIAIARSGCSVDGVEHFGPDELIADD